MISSLDSLVFKNPFEITRTQWNSSAHQNNQNRNGRISKAVPAAFKTYKVYNNQVVVLKTKRQIKSYGCLILVL